MLLYNLNHLSNKSFNQTREHARFLELAPTFCDAQSWQPNCLAGWLTR
jgi:hypothetical protein